MTSSDRLCASCGFSVDSVILHDGYALHDGPCLLDYLRQGPRYTPERIRDAFLVLVYDFESPTHL